jgi:hypothetical protein
LTGLLLDMTAPAAAGAEPNRMIAAIITGPDMTWFVKAAAPSAHIAPHKDAIFAFAKSFKLHAGDHAHDHDHDHDHDKPAAHVGAPEFKAPAHWKSEPGNSMITAAWAVAADGETARVTVMSLPGDGGGILANINRWRQQVNLPPVGKLEDQPMTRLEASGQPAALLDLIAPAGTQPQTRSLIVLLPSPAQTWFYKMSGTEKLLGKEKEAFVQFVQSSKVAGGAR